MKHGESSLSGAIILLAIWWFVVEVFEPDELILPHPVDVFSTLIKNSDIILTAAIVTFTEIVVGLAAAIPIAVAIALLAYWSKVAGKLIIPVAIFLQTLPKVAIAPILIFVFGYGLATKIILIIAISFFPVFIATLSGLKSLPETLELSINLFLNSRTKEIFTIRLIYSLPNILDGIKIAVPLSVIGAVVAEFLSSQEGLGYIILLGYSSGNTELAFSSIIMLSLIGQALFSIVSFVEALVWWRKK